MRSITIQNTLTAKRLAALRAPLQTIAGADVDRTKGLVCHHVSDCLEHKFGDMRRALKLQSDYARMPERELKLCRQLATETGKEVFRSINIASRLAFAIAAATKLAGGVLPKECDKHLDRLHQIFERMDKVQSRFFSRTRTAEDRRRTDLSVEMTPLVDELELAVRDFYAAAQRRFGLADLWGGQPN